MNGEKTLYKYYVNQANQSWRHDDRFETLAEAEAYAREKTHRNGETMGIFHMIHKTKVPEIVKNIEIEKVT